MRTLSSEEEIVEIRWGAWRVISEKERRVAFFFLFAATKVEEVRAATTAGALTLPTNVEETEVIAGVVTTVFSNIGNNTALLKIWRGWSVAICDSLKLLGV